MSEYTHGQVVGCLVQVSFLAYLSSSLAFLTRNDLFYFEREHTFPPRGGEKLEANTQIQSRSPFFHGSISMVVIPNFCRQSIISCFDHDNIQRPMTRLTQSHQRTSNTSESEKDEITLTLGRFLSSHLKS